MCSKTSLLPVEPRSWQGETSNGRSLALSFDMEVSSVSLMLNPPWLPSKEQVFHLCVLGCYYSPLFFSRETPKITVLSITPVPQGNQYRWFCWSKAPPWTAFKETRGGTALGLLWACTDGTVGHVLCLSWEDFRNPRNIRKLSLVANNAMAVKPSLEGNILYVSNLKSPMSFTLVSTWNHSITNSTVFNTKQLGTSLDD